MSSRWFSLLLPWLAIAAAGCTPDPLPATQLMVVVGGSVARLESVRVRVEGMGAPMVATADDLSEHPLPRTLAVVHDGGPLGPIVVTAEAMNGESSLLSRRAEVSFVRGRNLMLYLELAGSCLGKTCTEPDETCIAGSCEPIAMDDLPDWRGTAPKADGGSTGGDGGAPAGRGAAGSGGKAGAGTGGSSGAPASGRGGGSPAAGSGGAAAASCEDCAFDSATSEPHGTLECQDGSCMLSCDSGFIDADEARGNGCEEPTTAFAWRTSNVSPADPALTSAIASSLVIDCTVSLDLGSGALPAMVDVCGQQLQPVLLPQKAGGSEVVVLATRELSVAAGGKLSFSGSRPVVLLVYGDAEVLGELDVSARGTVAAAGSGIDCSSGSGMNGTSDGEDPGGGGGGGGFGTAGGLGGPATLVGGALGVPGGPGGAASGHPALAPLRGGCSGGAGAKSYGEMSAAGAGGGALQLSVAGTLKIAGTLAAAGGGGRPGTHWGDGGVGGGSGGALLLEATRIELQSAGWISANGGGGGEGRRWDLTLTQPSEDPGADGARRSALAADGGAGEGPGGSGAAGSTPATGAPTPALECGGGGGGGGVGRIVLHASDCQLEGGISPGVACSAHP